MCSQNAENAISETQISKIFQGGMPPDPPRRLVPSALAPPIFRQVSATDSKLHMFATKHKSNIFSIQ